MSTNSHANIPLWIQNRILHFFNRARTISDLLDGTIQDDPSDGAGRVMGPTLAARILRVRNQLPRRRFTALVQLDEVRGVGEGTLQDLVYSFGEPAAAFFKRQLYASNTLYESNWPVVYFRYELEEAAFLNLANDPEQLRAFVVDKVQEQAQAEQLPATATQEMVQALNTAYLDAYSNSSYEAAYALALWFYRFDADNWFSWEQIQAQTLAYFDYHMSSYPWMMELYLFKGFKNKGLLPTGISAKDLPVVVNHAEQSVTFWVSELYD